MTPQETRFVKSLIDSGVISFAAAAQLENARNAEPEDSGRQVWDLAVELGLVGPEQAEEVRAMAGGASTQSLAARGTGKRLGNYELISKLGQGGMGAVYKARQESMDRLVALKVLPKSLARNEEFITRFLREARAAGRLSHPNVVAGIDAGFADGFYYFAMEYVEGANLGSVLREQGPLPENTAAEYARQVALALDHAHGTGIVHRDVKPENILVTADGQAKLCDLGLARSSGEDMRVTQAGMAVGTPYYISPEQAMGREPDARSDIYSLGCTLYHLIAGRPVFDGPNPLAIMQKHIADTAAPLGEARPGVSRAIEAVVGRMIAREPAERYQTAAEAAEDLGKAVSGGVPAALGSAMAARRRAARQGTGSTRSTRSLRQATGRPGTTVRPAGAVPQGQDDAEGQGLEPVAGSRRTHWPLIIAAGLLALAFGLGGMLWGLHEGRPEGPSGGAGGSGNAGASTAPDPAEVERQRRARLAAELELVRALEARNPKAYASLVEKYTELAGRAGGTEYESAAREALAAIRARQEADQSAERLKALEDGLAKIRAFETASPEQYGEIMDRYSRFAEGARGTPFEARARTAGDEVRRRRDARAADSLVELVRQVERHRSAGNFGKALEAVAAFPEGLAPSVQDKLARLRDETRAVGQKRAQDLFAQGRTLAAAGRFPEAAEFIGAVRGLGLPGQENDVLAALAEVERLKTDAARRAEAEARRKYDAYVAEFDKLVKAGRMGEARQLGEKAARELGGEFGRRAQADAALASGAEGFMTDLRARLAAQKPGALWLNTPLGMTGSLQRYDPDRDTLDVKLAAGSTTLRLAELPGEELVQVLRKSSGGALSPEASLRAACHLLAAGRGAGVRELLAAAAAGGIKTADLETRLAITERGAKEVEAERLLAEFDRSFKSSGWAAAAAAGERLLKDFGDAVAVKARPDLPALVDQARHQGSPLRELTLTLQEGQPVPEAGLAAYRGTACGIMYAYEPHADTHAKVIDGRMAAGNLHSPVVRFAVTRREGGPLPDDAEILDARLALCRVGSYAPYLELRRFSADWSEKELTANSAAAGRRWKTFGGDVEDELVASLESRESAARAGKTSEELWNAPFWWYEFDVTAGLRAALKEGRNFGWRMDLFLDKASRKDHGNLTAFAGGTYERDPALRPKLILKVRCRGLQGGSATPVAPAPTPGGAFRAEWKELKFARGEAPSARTLGCSALAYDPKRKRSVLCGGMYPTGQNDVWALDLAAVRWTCLQKTDLASPEAKEKLPPPMHPTDFQCLAYDEAADVYRYSFWEWVFDPNANAWRKGPGRPRGMEGVMARGVWAYDPEGNRFLALNGGYAGFIYPDATKYERVPRIPEPQTFYDGGLVYDRRNRVFVLYGCMGAENRLEFTNTWAFDPATKKWTKMRPPQSPPQRDLHKLLWNDRLGVVVMCGQANILQRHTEDVWVYETAADRWTEAKAASSPPSIGATAYDASLDLVVNLNREGQTWVLRLER
ncbi:MAG TPA: protein kinase [Planctomycetota bacterium]|nr:protein kinase [Planctomycetota bacterium]